MTSLDCLPSDVFNRFSAMHGTSYVDFSDGVRTTFHLTGTCGNRRITSRTRNGIVAILFESQADLNAWQDAEAAFDAALSTVIPA